MPEITHQMGPFQRWSSGRMDLHTSRGMLTYLNLGGHRLYTPWGMVEWGMRIHNPFAPFFCQYGVHTEVTRHNGAVERTLRVAYGNRRTEATVTYVAVVTNPFED